MSLSPVPLLTFTPSSHVKYSRDFYPVTTVSCHAALCPECPQQLASEWLPHHPSHATRWHRSLSIPAAMASCYTAPHPKHPQQLLSEWLPPCSAIQHHGTPVPPPILFNMAPCYVAPRPERPQQSPSEQQPLHPVMPYHGTPVSPSIPATMVLCHVALHSERPQQPLPEWLTTVLYHTLRHAGATINPRHHGIMPCCTAPRAFTATVARVVHYCALPCDRHYGTLASPPIPVNTVSCYAAP